ncbi:hypothetical protein F4604DRAFT_1524501, partial [Suillus subluteus]
AVQCASGITHTRPSSVWPPTPGTSSTRLLRNASTKVCGPRMGNNFAQLGNEMKGALCPNTMPSTFAPGAAPPHMEPKDAPKHRKQNP